MFFLHLYDILIRVVYLFFSFVFLVFVFYVYINNLCFFLFKPLLIISLNSFIYTNILDLLYMYILLIFLIAFFFFLPFCLYFILDFISCGIYLRNKLYFYKIYSFFLFYVVLILFIIFIIFSYFLLYIHKYSFIVPVYIDNIINFNLELVINKYIFFFI